MKVVVGGSPAFRRSTFVFDSKGILKFEWRGLKVLGHVDEVLKTVVAMS